MFCLKSHCNKERTICSPGEKWSPSNTRLVLIPPSTPSFFLASMACLDTKYTGAVAVPRRYFRGEGRPPSAIGYPKSVTAGGKAVSLEAFPQQSSRGMTFGANNPIAFPCQPYSPFLSPRGNLATSWSSSTVSSPARRRKPRIIQGKDLRGLLKSIIRLRLIVIGAPGGHPACLPVSVQHRESSAKTLMNLPAIHVRTGLITPLPRQSIRNRHPAAWSWQPRGLLRGRELF